MKASKIDIIDTVADEKKLNMCLIQGWCSKKISQCCPKTEHHALIRRISSSHTLRAHDVTSNLVLVCFEFGRNFLQKGLRISAQPFKHTVQTDFSLLKNLFILNVLGLKNSTDFKENTKYYINLPIFEHFRC